MLSFYYLFVFSLILTGRGLSPGLNALRWYASVTGNKLVLQTLSCLSFCLQVWLSTVMHYSTIRPFFELIVNVAL